MRLLLDTHALLWWLVDDARLGRDARAAMSDSANTLLWSTASSWEIAIKVGLGRLDLPSPVAPFLAEHLARNGIGTLAVQQAHACAVASLPHHHHDPFDRMLVAVALVEQVAIVSGDVALDPYGVRRVW